jgi:hypothetical protein
MGAALNEAFADIYKRLEESQVSRDAYRTALANCYIRVACLLESKRFEITPDVRKVLSEAASDAREALRGL